jgi:hypothetical protein
MKKPTRKECDEANCWECMGYFADGKTDCKSVTCPNYTYMPYRTLEPDLWWMKYSHKRIGKVLKEDTKQNLSDEERQRRRERLLGLRANANG